jgi:hypothetical protein
MGGRGDGRGYYRPVDHSTTRRQGPFDGLMDGRVGFACAFLVEFKQKENARDKPIASQCLTHHVRVDTGSRHVDAASARGKGNFKGDAARWFQVSGGNSVETRSADHSDNEIHSADSVTDIQL